MEAVRILESDFIPRPSQRVPIYLTRYGLYADWEQQRAEYEMNAKVMDLFWKNWTVFDISRRLELPYSKVRQFVGRFVEEGLVREESVRPDYGRWSLRREGNGNG